MKPRRLAGTRHVALAAAVGATFLTLLSCGSDASTGADDAPAAAIGRSPEPSIRGGAAPPARITTSSPAPGPAGARAAPQPRRRAKPLYWGATIGEQFTGDKPPWDMEAVRKFQRVAGKGLSLISFYIPFYDCNSSPCVPFKFPTTPLQNARDYGAIPVLSWSSDSNPPRVRQPAFQLTDIIRGRYDSYIRSWAVGAREWGHPFFLRFDWEMNGFWFAWGANANGNRPKQFAKAWRHVHRIFSANGANNVSWVWCPNIDLSRDLVPLERLYPGNRYVDWTCVDGFNWGSRPDSAGWQSFSEVFRSTYRRIARLAPRKPMMIGEMGSTTRGGSKAAWIRNFLRVLPRRFRKIRAFVWFDVHDRGTNWPIETSRSARRAFRRGIRRPIYRANAYGDLSRAPITPPGR
ncbi:MAG TPA: glycosyl hydrolase [Solirubrobacterales bacterium]|nr:glycosyl hydrolase [Solirubrobacterales bacterium]